MVFELLLILMNSVSNKVSFSHLDLHHEDSDHYFISSFLLGFLFLLSSTQLDEQKEPSISTKSLFLLISAKDIQCTEECDERLLKPEVSYLTIYLLD